MSRGWQSSRIAVAVILSLLLSMCALRAQNSAGKKAVYPAGGDHKPPAWFIDVAAQAGIAVRNVNGGSESKRYIIETTGSGVAVIDYDRDGWPDIFMINGTSLPGKVADKSQPTSHLFHNNHDGTFTDITMKAGLA